MIHVYLHCVRNATGLGRCMVVLAFAASLASAASPGATAPVERLTVLDGWSYYSDATNAAYRVFTDEALPPLTARKAAVEQLATRADWERYRDEARKKIFELVGPFPEKTPLNARITGVVKKAGYRIEKVIYESQPGLHVTAALFVPEPLQGRAPAIVYCSGHHDAGFRAPNYMLVILNLVKKGFVVLAFDPLGQGERLQYYDPRTGNSEFGDNNSTREHSRAGSQCFLTGDSLARYMIWDGIRSVDYLLTRPEVDPARLGINGRSGGGTQTAYIAACDDRLFAAAPENYVTTFESVLKMRGPQDPEQNFYRGLARGFDQPDLLIARAPKPTLLVATTRDIFNIEGTQAALAEARRAHSALGDTTETMAMTVDDAEHASTLKNREATYAFFRKHLNLPGSVADETVERPTAEELRITETGQVSTALRSETVFSLNRRRAEMLGEKLEGRRRDLPSHLVAVKAEAARLAGYIPLAAAASRSVFAGRFPREGYALEKYLLPVDHRYAIPVLVMVPDAPTKKVVLYLHPQGKSTLAAVGGEMEKLVKQGCTVIAPDMIGMPGEIGPGVVAKPEEGPPRLWYGYVLLGKGMIGRQMEDVMRVVRFAEAKYQVAPDDLIGFARGESAPMLLHTAAIAGVFGKIAILDAPLSYRSLVTSLRFAPKYLAAAVPAALTAYDLPDLIACVAPRSVLVVDPRDGMGELAEKATIAQEMAVTTRAYAQNPARLKMVSLPRGGSTALNTAVAEWLR
ncbi:MAG TPA: acetylxylan esterase [Opitutaceae bacterium]|nr:acetylxylan esterase [Opitutaceae bacterium]